MTYAEKIRNAPKLLNPRTLSSFLGSTRIVRYLIGKSDPHAYIAFLVKQNKCKKLMEIGVFRGDGALRMISAALENARPEEIEYHGFDVFGRPPARDKIRGDPIKSVRSKLEQTGARINLYEGDTLKTLPLAVGELPPMDLICIDGGHSFETVDNDWKYSQKLMNDSTLVVFDDYDVPGPKAVVDGIDRKKFEVKTASHFSIRNKVIRVKKIAVT